ncbi:ABC transporter permease [Cytophagales bacterium WSM2-2]|nr:ABC transporter permease [Cytophagales bacterium WSM2-2]
MIYLIVNFELSYNRSMPGYDRIYRIHSKFSGSFSGINRGAPTGVAPYVKENFKGIEHVSLFFSFTTKLEIPQANENKKFDREKAAIVNEDYFKVFSFYKWLAGSAGVLSKPSQVVLTESQAKKYFGTISPDKLIGKRIVYRDSLETTVAGVVADPSIRTDLDYTEFISMPTVESTWLKKNYRLEEWSNTNSSTQVFVLAQQQTTLKQLQDQLPLLSKIYNEKNTWAKNDFAVQPMADLHFNAEVGIFDSSRSPAHLSTMYTLIAVAILLLVIGAINFINLETAQAVRRAKEVGVRKVLGSSRMRLTIQFICESLVLTFISIVLAIPLTELGLSVFSEFVPRGVTLNFRDFVPFLALIVVSIGFLAGAYPAFVLSSFLPVLALKNQAHANSSQSRTAFLRKTLIVFQFTFAQVLILGTLMVGWQIRYLLNKDLGFRQDAVIYFDSPWWEKDEKISLLRTELASVPEIKQLSMSDAPPAENGWSSSVVKYNNGKEEISVNAYRKFGDTAYIPFYNIKLLAGRNLLVSDTARELIINETMMKSLGFTRPLDALDQLISLDKSKVPVVGVVQDFNFQSLHHSVEPVMMANAMKNFGCFNVRLATANQSGDALKNSLEKIEKAWKKIYPDAEFKSHFLDETIRGFYETEQRTSKLARTAMGLAIFISCLGLFGLASYTSVQRTKEIGVRKVMGATVRQIVFLLSRDFLLLVLISFICASPVAWYIINRWLQGFPYRTELSIWMFGLTALLIVIVAFVTVSYQTFKAANSNPVNSLRSE